MAEYRLARKVVITETVTVEAPSVEAALVKYDEDEIEDDWNEDDVSLGEGLGLASITELDADGLDVVRHDIAEGVIVQSVCPECAGLIGYCSCEDS